MKKDLLAAGWLDSEVSCNRSKKKEKERSLSVSLPSATQKYIPERLTDLLHFTMNERQLAFAISPEAAAAALLDIYPLTYTLCIVISQQAARTSWLAGHTCLQTDTQTDATLLQSGKEEGGSI